MSTFVTGEYRTGLTADDARALAISEGASHVKELSEGLTGYYRTTGYAAEFAMARREGHTWKLSIWRIRVIPTIPPDATPL